MSSTGIHGQPDEALMDLLIKQVIEGLSPSERSARDAWDDSIVRSERRDLERTVAAITLVILGDPEPPPPALRARIAQQADTHFAAELGTPRESVAVFRKPALNPNSMDALHRPGGARIGGWLVAAACFLLALIGWMRPLQPVRLPIAAVHDTLPPEVIKETVLAPRPSTPAQERDALIVRAETLKVTLNSTRDPAAAGVSADVVWDAATQTGFLHLVGLKANDPRVHQYQAWIFDGARDKRYPVDCAVFDVPPDASEVIISIRAAVPIRLANAFAVTVEKPGGVVVSDRAHVIVLGAAG